MREVNNRILGVLVLVAMCVSLAGTLATFSLIRVVEEVPVTGLYSGITNVTVVRFGAIDVLVGLVEFGEMVQDANNDTSDYSPHPFVIENNGTVFVNVTICSEDLWPSAAPNPDKYYQFNASDDNATETALSALQSGWVAPWTDMPNNGGGPGCVGSEDNLVTCLNNSDDADSINVHINITVPTDASAGTHTATVTLVADEFEGACGPGT